MNSNDVNDKVERDRRDAEALLLFMAQNSSDVTKKSPKFLSNFERDLIIPILHLRLADPVFCLRGGHLVLFEDVTWFYTTACGDKLGNCKNCKNNLTPPQA